MNLYISGSNRKNNSYNLLNKLKEKDDILYSLKDLDIKVDYDLGRMFIHTNNYDEVLKRVRNVFGIHEINVCYIFDTTDFDVIATNIVNLLKEKEFKTFKVEPNETLFIDDREENLVPFKWLGGHTHFFDLKNLNATLNSIETYVISNSK